MNCGNCGAELPEGTGYCSKCGVPAGGSAQPPMAQPPMAQPPMAQPAGGAAQPPMAQPAGSAAQSRNVMQKPKSRKKAVILVTSIAAVLVIAAVICWVLGIFTPEIELTTLPLEADDLYEMGGYTWQVLEIRDGEALLITRDIIDARAFDNDGKTNIWSKSSLRKWLNREFYSGFSAEEKSRILSTNVVNNDNPWYGTDGGQDTVDNVFLLSIEEVVEYFGDSGALQNWNGEDDSIRDDYGDNRRAILNMTDEQQKSAAKRMAKSFFSMATDGHMMTEKEAIEHFERRNGDVYWWWLRSPGARDDLAAYVHGGRGGLCVFGDLVGYESYGIRPVMWIQL